MKANVLSKTISLTMFFFSLFSLTSSAAAQSAAAQTVIPGAAALCSAATLKGQYSHVKNGFAKVPDPNDPSKKITVPFASISLFTFDGRGNFKGLADAVFDGQTFGENIPLSDTYTVNSDCTGTISIEVFSGDTELFAVSADMLFDDRMHRLNGIFTSIVTPGGVSLPSAIAVEARRQ